MDEAVLNCVNELIALDLACAAAYEAASAVCKDDEIRSKLGEFKGDHDRHVQELSNVLRQAGKEPLADLDAKGVIIKGFTMLSAQEDRTAVLAMRGNEELSNNAYASALKAKLPEDLRQLIHANFQDERRHMAWIRGAVILRGWDVEQPEIREAAEERQRKAA